MGFLVPLFFSRTTTLSVVWVFHVFHEWHGILTDLCLPLYAYLTVVPFLTTILSFPVLAPPLPTLYYSTTSTSTPIFSLPHHTQPNSYLTLHPQPNPFISSPGTIIYLLACFIAPLTPILYISFLCMPDLRY